MQREVIILAGGFGKRLLDVVSVVPKCLAPINGTPFLDYLIKYLKKYGISRFILSLGYKSDLIISYINEFHPDIDVTFVIEDSPLGTGGAIKASVKEVKVKNVLVVNGDTFFNINLNDFYNAALTNQYPFTIALQKIEKNYRYGFVELDEKNEIIRFCEKQESNNVFINTGFYIINKEQVNFDTNNDIFSLEKDFFESDLRKIKLYGMEFNNEFIDIGIPKDFNRAQTLFKQLNINN
jgi:D-glycero-alpha-D-manno-heptose 1-phosphate guanylyltransferase